ncbi:MAG: single-stranded-DNA-specific exonuclease RecJ [Gammaproteobacteria bacterium]|nr:single-stranded-DNA-specific exonuclease RecJ [Gammaproteobacteria bacterium]
MLVKRRESESTATLEYFHPVLHRIYTARGIKHESELATDLHALLPFDTLIDIDKACSRLEQALRSQERVLIIGDFDADGATSTALAVSALRVLGVQNVDYLVPNRFEFGYGLTPAIVAVAQSKAPSLIITVDNGITSIEGVAAANTAGIDVLITDHHLPADALPAACAIVNPNQGGDTFPSKSIAGVGVIFYVMLAFRRHLQTVGWFEAQGIAKPNMSQFLDLVALGTVADVVGLDQNNRIMVSQGVHRIRKGYMRPGIAALIAVAKRQPERLRESDLGFAVAPRLNAAGRLDDMSLGIECLLSETQAQADALAQRLDGLNTERRRIETEMKEQALATLEKLVLAVESGTLPSALCLFDPSWHQGVIGVLAGRLKERYHRPVIVFAKASDTELKGSARSITGVNIRDVLAAVDKSHPGLMTKFGGHAMAAGMSLHPDALPAFKTAFCAEMDVLMEGVADTQTLLTDGALVDEDLTQNLAKLLHEGGPWGQQFPEPMFDNVFEILDQRLVGQHHLKLTLSLYPKGEPIDAIMFQVDLNAWPNHRAKFIHAVYKMDINTYQGRSRLQLIVVDMCVQEAAYEI